MLHSQSAEFNPTGYQHNYSTFSEGVNVKCSLNVWLAVVIRRTYRTCVVISILQDPSVTQVTRSAPPGGLEEYNPFTDARTVSLTT